MNPPPKLSIVRACPEHRVRIFERERFWERYLNGELRLKEEKTLMVHPCHDYNGKLRTHNVNTYLVDDRYPEKDERHIVAHTHHFMADDGSIASSGKRDPKELIVGDVQYRQLEHRNPSCALCVGGDWISPAERFMSSTYRPEMPE